MVASTPGSNTKAKYFQSYCSWFYTRRQEYQTYLGTCLLSTEPCVWTCVHLIWFGGRKEVLPRVFILAFPQQLKYEPCTDMYMLLRVIDLLYILIARTRGLIRSFIYSCSALQRTISWGNQILVFRKHLVHLGHYFIQLWICGDIQVPETMTHQCH